MNDEKTTTPTNEKKESLAKEWLSKPNGRPPKVIASLVKEFSKKGIEIKAIVQARALQKDIARAKKAEDFLKAFIESDGNLTETGLKVFDTKDRGYAATAAGEYMKANQGFMRMFLEKKGYTLGWMLELLAKKAVEGRSADFIDRLFRIAGYGELQPPKYIPPTIININQTQKKLAREYGFEEGEVIDGNAEDTT